MANVHDDDDFRSNYYGRRYTVWQPEYRGNNQLRVCGSLPETAHTTKPERPDQQHSHTDKPRNRPCRTRTRQQEWQVYCGDIRQWRSERGQLRGSLAYLSWTGDDAFPRLWWLC